MTRVTPAASKAPWAQGVISTPSGSTISPLTRSSPTRRTCCQGKVGASTVMGSASGSGICSTMITASVPGGIRWPVLMGKASRPTGKSLGWSGVAPKVAAAATAKPSMAAWCAAGEDLRAITGAAVTRPAAAVTGTSSASMVCGSNRANQSSRASSNDFMLR